jgi:hypothetical protein
MLSMAGGHIATKKTDDVVDTGMSSFSSSFGASEPHKLTVMKRQANALASLWQLAAEGEVKSDVQLPGCTSATRSELASIYLLSRVKGQ